MEAVGSVDMGCRDESGGTQMDGVRRFKVKDRINQLARAADMLKDTPSTCVPTNNVEIALIS